MFTQPLSPLETYTQEVNHHLQSLPSHIREEEVQELRSHLELLSTDLRAQGHSADRAASLAIGRFGSPRRIGLRLRDVWEGNRGVALTVLTTVFSNWLIQLLSTAGFFYTLFKALSFHNELAEPLHPFFVAWLWTNLLLLPFAWNWMLGQWGGRRVIWAALMAYSPILLIAPFGPVITDFSLCGLELNFAAPTIPLLTVLVAVMGAWGGSVARRERRWAAISGAPFAQASLLVNCRRPVRLLPLLLAVIGTGAVGITGYAVLQRRVSDTLHPATPEIAVRVLLSAPGFNSEMLPSTNVTTRLLPPTTPQERAGLERWVAYTATMHATPEYRQRRLAFYRENQRLARAGQQPYYPVSDVEAALKRLAPEGYVHSGVARVKPTAQGWKVDTSGDEANQPWAWLYDVSYADAFTSTAK